MSRKILRKLPGYAILSAFAVVTTLPMLYLISTALKSNGALYKYPPQFFPAPDELTLENFAYILAQNKFIRNFANSVFVSITTVVISALISAALAYVLSRFEFRGRRVLFGFIILTMIIPGTTLIVPQYELAVTLNVINSLGALIPFYIAWVIPFSTFMIKGFVDNIPREFDAAVSIDGGNVLTVFVKIIIPLSMPAIASVSIFNFLTAWEEFVWANTIISDDLKRTLPIAISGFFGQHQFTQWGYVFALSTLSLVPVLLVFVFFQKYFVSGLQAGGIKG